MSGSLIVLGTTSDAGKSVVTTGVCRALSRLGLRVAPFKAQNMSNNSMVTAEGLEMGRAQWVQAVAARAEPEVAMNPVLLKPGSDRGSHVIVMGKPAGVLDARDFVDGRAGMAHAAYAAFDDLAGRYDAVVCEGAGSPAEVNLRRHDFINLGLARHAGIPAVLVGDIDRGGVFAAMHGTLALLEEADQALVCGLVVNKFRGDLDLLRPGLATLESVTGRPVLGVLPWQPDLWLDSEDSLSIGDRGAHPTTGDRLRIAVVRLPRISNFTDIDALCLEPQVDVAFVDHPRALHSVDVVVLPGTRATMDDLRWLRERGLDSAIRAHAANGGAVLGICGGFQMLGRAISDPAGVEGEPGARMDGIGLLDMHTTFAADKVLARPTGRALGAPASGYEIHHGRADVGDDEEFLAGARRGSVFGTMWHGCLEGDELRAAWLDTIADTVGVAGFRTGSVSFPAAREARIDAVADAVERHLDLDAILSLIEHGPTPGLPTVRGGLVRASRQASLRAGAKVREPRP